jgi:hypothetical protein
MTPGRTFPKLRPLISWRTRIDQSEAVVLESLDKMRNWAQSKTRWRIVYLFALQVFRNICSYYAKAALFRIVRCKRVLGVILKVSKQIFSFTRTAWFKFIYLYLPLSFARWTWKHFPSTSSTARSAFFRIRTMRKNWPFNRSCFRITEMS